jgi:serine/alanine adding enzyme
MTAGEDIAVRIADEADLGRWQGFVDETADAGCMHHAAWYGVLREGFWVTPYYLIAEDASGRVLGILPLYYSRSPLTGSHLSSLEGGALAVAPAAAAELLAAARSLRDSIGARYLQLRGGLAEDEGAIKADTVHTIVATGESSDKIWERMKQSGRRGVRKGEKEDIGIELDQNLDRFEEFYRVFAIHMRELGTPVMGLDAFLAMRRYLGPNRMRLYLAGRGRQVIGGMLCLVNAGKWTSYFAIMRTAAGAEYANYALYWRVIRDASSLGIVRFDLGRSVPGSTVHLFKQRWGGADINVPYCFYPRLGARVGDMGLHRLKAKGGLPTRIWSHLPLAVCNRLGPLLRKQLPFI